jgi:hypothetical protein
MEFPTPTPPDESQSLEKCPRCVHGRIGNARLTCTLCFGAGMVQPWVADQERAQQASWERYLSGRAGHLPEGAALGLGECAKCWPTRCPQCPWSPPPFGPEQGLDLAA